MSKQISTTTDTHYFYTIRETWDFSDMVVHRGRFDDISDASALLKDIEENKLPEDLARRVITKRTITTTNTTEIVEEIVDPVCD